MTTGHYKLRFLLNSYFVAYIMLNSYCIYQRRTESNDSVLSNTVLTSHKSSVLIWKLLCRDRITIENFTSIIKYNFAQSSGTNFNLTNSKFSGHIDLLGLLSYELLQKPYLRPWEHLLSVATETRSLNQEDKRYWFLFKSCNHLLQEFFYSYGFLCEKKIA